MITAVWREFANLARDQKQSPATAMILPKPRRGLFGRRNGHPDFKESLESEGLVDTFLNTLKMEPHYGGWMHGRTHGFLEFEDDTGTPVAIAHDLNHLTVLSHDQTQPFMNDMFNWPQWPALDAPEEDVIDYFQSMVTLGDPKGKALNLRPGRWPGCRARF